MMTPRYEAWLLSLAQRDATLISLALSAVALVAAWLLLDVTPVRFRSGLKNLYLAGGMGLWIATWIYSMTMR